MFVAKSEFEPGDNLSRVGKYKSILYSRSPRRRESLPVPDFSENERWYMVKITNLSNFPKKISRWKAAVASMLSAYGIKPKESAPVYLTIDYRQVNTHCTHRRGGLHVDGNWIEINSEGVNVTEHGTKWGTYSYLRGLVNTYPFEYKPETIVLYSNISACIGYLGDFSGEILDDGDCSLISTEGMSPVRLEEHQIYAGNETFLHESIPVEYDCNRCMIRINVPGLDINTLQ